MQISPFIRWHVSDDVLFPFDRVHQSMSVYPLLTYQAHAMGTNALCMSLSPRPCPCPSSPAPMHVNAGHDSNGSNGISHSDGGDGSSLLESSRANRWEMTFCSGGDDQSLTFVHCRVETLHAAKTEREVCLSDSDKDNEISHGLEVYTSTLILYIVNRLYLLPCVYISDTSRPLSYIVVSYLFLHHHTTYSSFSPLSLSLSL